MYTDGLVPYDGVPTKEFVAIALPVTVIFVFLASAGIFFAIACLIFNFVHRNKKYAILLHAISCQDLVWHCQTLAGSREV